MQLVKWTDSIFTSNIDYFYQPTVDVYVALALRGCPSMLGAQCSGDGFIVVVPTYRPLNAMQSVYM